MCIHFLLPGRFSSWKPYRIVDFYRRNHCSYEINRVKGMGLRRSTLPMEILFHRTPSKIHFESACWVPSSKDLCCTQKTSKDLPKAVCTFKMAPTISTEPFEMPVGSFQRAPLYHRHHLDCLCSHQEASRELWMAAETFRWQIAENTITGKTRQVTILTLTVTQICRWQILCRWCNSEQT